jgi:bifunctional DNA-binding transcriptional regulator/antitoxin component of YhaV-PrlF toxin-antitoxin module
MITQVDKLGRIVLKKKLREKYGDRFIVIPGDGEIVLRSIRIDRDKLAEKLDRYSLSRLKEMAYEQAMDDVEERLLKKK